MRRRQPLVGLMGWALSSTVLGADVEIPHQFEAGTPAVAEEINQNFSALAESIALLSETLNDLESKLENRRRGLSVYVDGVRVGTFLGREAAKLGNVLPDEQIVVYAASESLATAQAVEVRSDKGYLFRVATDALSPEGALIPAVFHFLNADCSGTPHLRVRRPADVISPSTVHPWMLNQGIVLGAPPSYPSTEYYAPAGAQVLENVASVHAHLPDPFGCVPLDTPQNLVELLPNDPSVTGVSHGLSGKVTIAP